MRWREFTSRERELFERSGLRGAFRDRRLFDYLLMHGDVADGSGFSVHDLDPAERRALAQLVGRYLAEFDDPGVVSPIATASIDA
jgi:hypothetical protein